MILIVLSGNNFVLGIIFLVFKIEIFMYLYLFLNFLFGYLNIYLRGYDIREDCEMSLK